ncbi:tRNA pseudouridine(55) synthase TruB [Corynebacterium glyciniphilum]|uniref:tRNA pseudouridine(55) synthase TruB n=1 Tax=Corynebacterium glyciniphilum TaxID=1404244 RepID=UPI00265034D7|nr:tRNA pseudouridine(55) synthase TruB [Corynebacterium glyciniphilum]MDN5683495.1 tRNA pseudouridine(55) synthase TruB [Corynebacterium glyciniphilum]MDN6706629.1 tRNA pseudouridine(55) synthase TruB [Corynebacterium glyciniphilum]
MPGRESADGIIARSGLVIIDKPAGMTSHDVVSRCRRIFGTRRVGHSGTLDPMATGVLVVGVERGTKFLAHVVTHDKRYDATVRFGSATVTDDIEGDTISTAPAEAMDSLTVDGVREAFATQSGEIMQRPSSVSSIKVNGRRAHELVREGVDVVLPERPVTVHELVVTDIRIDGEGKERVAEADISVHCSSGTYIRSIARDVGENLGVGGHLSALRRTSAGPFAVTEARTLEELSAVRDDTDASPALTMSLDEAMSTCFPVREVSGADGDALSLGKWLSPVGMRGVYAAVTPDGRAVALLEEKGTRAASVFVARPAGMD